MSKISEEIKQQHEKNKQKLKSMGPVKLTILIIMVIGTICSFVFYDYFYGSHNAWCTTKDYDNALLNNIIRIIPKLVTCIQVVTIVLVVITIILFILKKFFTKTQRSVTVTGLICNLIRWLTGIVLVIVVLAIWGVDTTALITGAGVVTLVIGLGMQSLIADIVAGLFIVFENEFNVGDWITVDGFIIPPYITNAAVKPKIQRDILFFPSRPFLNSTPAIKPIMPSANICHGVQGP